MSDKFEEYSIKRYRFWTVYVAENQQYLGRAVIWLTREGDMQRLSSLTSEERAELWDIVLPEYESAVAKLWAPDHMNYAWLGNYFPAHKGHGHMHVIPRYASSRVFQGNTFVDAEWGNMYGRTPGDSPKEVVVAVRDALRAEMN